MRSMTEHHATTQIFKHATMLVGILLAGIVVVAFVIPLGYAFAPFFSDKVRKIAYTDGYSSIIQTIAYTFKVSIGSTFVALLIGLPTAFFVARRNFLLRRLLLSFGAIPLAMPALIIALGYVSVFGMGGIINTILAKLFHTSEPTVTFLYSPLGLIITQGFYNFPLVATIISDGWAQISPTYRNAAQTLGANERKVFLKITLPELMPSIVASTIPVFLYCFSSFLIVLLFGTVGGSTIEVEIYRAAHTTLDFHRASLLALLETSCSIGTVFIYSAVTRKNTNNGEIFFPHREMRPKIGKSFFQTKVSSLFERIFFCLLIFLIAVFFVSPFIGLTIFGINSADFFSTFRNLFSSRSFISSLYGTLKIAPFTASLSCIVAFIFACAIRVFDPKGKNAVLQTVPFLPMAVSSVILGYGITRMQIRPTFIILVIAETMLYWPVAFRPIYNSLAKIPEDTLNAARLFSTHKTDLVFKIFLPSCKIPILSAFGFCFAMSIGDTTLPVVLSIPKFSTIALYTYRLASTYRFSGACAGGTILFLLCISIFAIIKRFDKSAK